MVGPARGVLVLSLLATGCVGSGATAQGSASLSTRGKVRLGIGDRRRPHPRGWDERAANIGVRLLPTGLPCGMAVFEKRTQIRASPAVVFAFHERPDALALLTPPWDATTILSKDPTLQVGARTVLETPIGPFKQRLVAVHVAYEPGRMFADEMVEGPFARWLHTHTMESDNQGGCWLTDHIEYALPLGWLGALGGGWYARRKLRKMFAHRHEVTRAACEAG